MESPLVRKEVVCSKTAIIRILLSFLAPQSKKKIVDKKFVYFNKKMPGFALISQCRKPRGIQGKMQNVVEFVSL